MNNLPIRNIICIDLKSFFASCECIERNLDPYKTALVVSDPNRGNGAITLAVTPYLKKKGIKNRCRIFEIPKNIKYLRVRPRMSLYIKKSTDVINIYLDFVAKEDIHIYSIDEVFLDLTYYLKLYKKTDYELAIAILKRIYKETGLTATCGIGPNLLLAKIAMDIEAKHNSNNIAKWTYDDINSKLWKISPLRKMWGIGPRMETNLNNMGIHSIKDLALYDKNKLIKKFGILGEELWNHANGIDLSKISDLKVPPKEKSINHSQILFKNYNAKNIKLIIEEMITVLLTRLRKMKQKTSLIGFGIGYSKDIDGGFYHQTKLDQATDKEKVINKTCFYIFDTYYDGFSPIRKVSIAFGKLKDKKFEQLNLFEDINDITLEDNLVEVLDQIHEKYGKNIIFKATSLLSDSTLIERNNKIGGHAK